MDVTYDGMLRHIINGDYKVVAEVVIATAFSEKQGDKLNKMSASKP